MSIRYCTQGHENPPNSRFCHRCGEALQMANSELLGDRYRVLRELGRGGFGRTYLAEDTNRFNERCVLKEFAPQARGTYALQKAQELFEREAGTLYKLQHPQIPKFRELLRVKQEGSGQLYLVQDYVEGATYRALLRDRKGRGECFHEAEVTEILVQLLPVLDYIHSLGVIHRDISPDNLICRQSDGLPVLIDFGGVKQVAATVMSQVSPSQETPGTRLGKRGYAPEEQMQMGRVSPHSDLYALAATLVVLLTGKEPQELIDPHTLTWHWRDKTNVSAQFATILDTILARVPGDRYQSVPAVKQALANIETNGKLLAPSPQKPQPSPLEVSSTEATIALGQGAMATAMPKSSQSDSSPWTAVLFWIVLVLGLGGMSWALGYYWMSADWDDSNSPAAVEPTEPESPYSPEERQRKEALRDRRKALGIDYQFYVSLTNQLFYQQYPEQRNQVLTNDPEDDIWRKRWDETATEVLNRLETLSIEARGKLGGYKQRDLDRRKAAANQLHVSSRALNDVTDAAFFELFPQQRGQNFINQPIGQVWHAIAEDKLDELRSGKILTEIQFDRGEYRQQFDREIVPGEGQVDIAYLGKNNFLRVNLRPSSPSILFSIYTPSGNAPILEDSQTLTWSGTLPESGYYEFVVVSDGSEATIAYGLDIAIDKVTSTETPTPDAPEEEQPSETELQLTQEAIDGVETQSEESSL